MGNHYQNTTFLKGVDALAQLPPDTGREVAIAGRSNAGKSSALNRITHQRQLARVSKTPGRTQMINFFTIEPECYLVDLPGYGYAHVPEAMRQRWGALLGSYLATRAALCGLVQVMDIRHPMTALDEQLLEACAARLLPVHVLLTKADKLSRGAALATVQQVQRTVNTYPQTTTVQVFSALTGLGVEAAQAQLDTWYTQPLNH